MNITWNWINPFKAILHLCEYGRRWLSERENLFFVLLIVIHLLPIWFFKYFPSQDGPIHIETASVLREYHFPDRPLFRQYYSLNTHLVPNWFSQIVLVGLMHIVPPLVAEKILLSGYIILLPISMRYSLQAIRPDSGFLALLAFPFIYNFLFHLGFYNFCYSLAMFFFVIGYWLKYQNRFKPHNIGTLTFLSLLLYFCHIFSLVTVYIAIAILTVWLIFFDIKQQIAQQQFCLGTVWKVFQLRVLPLCAFLPTLILVMMFLDRKETTVTGNILSVNIWQRLFKLLSLYSLTSFELREILLSTIFAVLFAAVSLYLLRSKIIHPQLNGWDGFLLVVAAYVVIYFMGSDKLSGSASIKERLSLYPFFTLILWFGTQSYHRVVKLRIQRVAVGITLIMLALHTIKYAELNNYLEEYVTGMHQVVPNTTLLPISFSHAGHTADGRPLSRKVLPFLNASGYIAAQKHIVNLWNYQAHMGFFPVTFRPHLSPYSYIGVPIITRQPSTPAVDFFTYSQQTEGQVDYVLLWQLTEELRTHKNTKSIFRQLEKRYQLVYTSSPQGFIELYRRKDLKLD